MPIFGHRHHRSERWHLDIDSHLEVGGKQINLREYNSEKQPWSRMRQSTDRYLSKKKDSKTAKSRDELLRKLILGHGRKDIAIVACGHAMSSDALEDLLLSDALATLDSLDDFKVLLHCIHAASLVNEVVSTDEGREAVALLEREYSADCSYLEHLLNIILEYPTSQSLACLRMHTVISIKLETLKVEFDKLRTGKRWSQAHSLVKWLSTFDETSEKSSKGHRKVKSLLDDNLPTWLAWARWQPNLDRIANWDKLDDKLRDKLRNILDLDGPDFDCHWKTHGRSLGKHLLLPHRDSLPQRLNGSTLDECRDMAERLLCLLENIVTHHPDDIALFHHALTGTDIIKRNLILLEKLICGEFGTISITVAEAYSLRGATPEMQNEAVKRLLRLLNTKKFFGLRDAFAVDFAALMTDLIREERDHLIKAIRSTQTVDVPFASYGFLHSELQKASWLWPFLEESLPSLMDDWPSTKDLSTLKDIYFTLHTVPVSTRSSVIDLISYYVLGNPGSLDTGMRRLTKSLLRLWQTVRDPIRRLIALSLVPGAANVTDARCACIEQLPALADAFVRSLWTNICHYDACESPEEACIAVAKLLAEASLQMVDIAHWRPVLYRMVFEQGDGLFKYALQQLKIPEWVQFLENVQLLYGTTHKWVESRSPAVLKPGLSEWGRRLLPYTDLIESLKTRLDQTETIRCLYFEAANRVHVQDALERILIVLEQCPERTQEETSLQISILDRLSWNGQNADEICNALVALNGLSRTGFEVCTRLQYLTNSSHYVTRTFLEAWLHDPSISVDDARALKLVFRWPSTALPKDSLQDEELALATEHLDSEYADLLDEARRLAALRGSLKTVDLPGVTELLASIDIEDCTPIEDALASLPTEVVNAVEIVGEKEVEIIFPLTHFTQVQRTALGIGTSQSFVLLLELCDHKANLGRFCIHLDSDSKTNDSVRTIDGMLDTLNAPWINTCRLGSKENHPPCVEQSNLFKYHFSQYLQRKLITSNMGTDFTTLSELHDLITQYLKDIGKYCITCGKDYSINLRKPVHCIDLSCSSLFQNAPLPVLLSDLVQDPLATDLLLSSVYAAALTGNMSLLPNLPGSTKHSSVILSLLDNLPSTASLAENALAKATVGKSWSTLSQLSTPSPSKLNFVAGSDLLSYILTSHRSFLTAATGRLKIPSMPPGTLQFVLANSSPEREAAFAAEVDLRPQDSETRILFHGTSPDRLFAILCSGLKILSETPLETHGAVYGRGIYMADEPSTSYLYCSHTLSKNWKNSALDVGKGYKILLGCEQAGPRLVTGEDVIHVVRDERTLMLRYVFLIPGETETMPVARHLTPGMGSVAKGLRSGAL
ncbi:uncharacterized protein PAC_13838 [Phialocephala subalpina]|uniref:PARP catalytic domain-containing protein n=1 Tax=Phialocephala subalpina TaxID=576137 RepID=A0A1L7XFX8_9HELO|nr:uncharacterized protein PAC_13838 [Phialocephala subalpina]